MGWCTFVSPIGRERQENHGHTRHALCILPPGRAGWSETTLKAILPPETPLKLAGLYRHHCSLFSFLLCLISCLCPSLPHNHVTCGPNLQLSICFLGSQPGIATGAQDQHSSQFSLVSRWLYFWLMGCFFQVNSVSNSDPFTFSRCVTEELYSPSPMLAKYKE